MATSSLEEQHAPPSTWAKARTFFGGKRRSSQQVEPPNGAGSHDRVDDDAQDQAGPDSEAIPAVEQAATTPLTGTDQAERRRSQDSAKLETDVGDGVHFAEGEGEDGEVELEADEEGRTVIEFLHKGTPYFWLHNHFAIPVYYDNIRYPSSEHLFQSLKFPHRPDIAKAIRKAETASEAVRTAKKHAADVRKGWRQEGLNIIAMREVLLLKFTQHSSLKHRLLQTGDAELVLASPTDVFWGIGRGIGSTKAGLGRNELGKALMKTRDSLLTSAGLGWGSAAKTV